MVEEIVLSDLRFLVSQHAGGRFSVSSGPFEIEYAVCQGYVQRLRGYMFVKGRERDLISGIRGWMFRGDYRRHYLA